MKLFHPKLIASITLIAGTTVGAGILALPTATLPAGVLPSTLVLLLVWIYMVVSGLLIAEVNLNLRQQTGRTGLGLLAMAQVTLGTWGAWLVGIFYLFKHYALLVAYMSRGGDILASTVQAVGQPVGVIALLPTGWGAVLFVLIYGGFLYVGRQHWVEWLNNALVAIAVIAFCALVSLAFPQIQPQQLLIQHWSAVTGAIPVMLVAFVYHNVVPIVVQQLDGDIPAIRRAITFGSAIPLAMFLAWNMVILGIVSPGEIGGFDPLEVLRLGEAGNTIGTVVAVFSEVAIATSFIGFVYGLLNFFTDAFQMTLPQNSLKPERFGLFALILLPPLGFSSFNPNLFIDALEVAGAFGISVLFGIIPALMAWRHRYHLSEQKSDLVPSVFLVPGGRVILLVMIGLAGGAIVQQLSKILIA